MKRVIAAIAVSMGLSCGGVPEADETPELMEAAGQSAEDIGLNLDFCKTVVTPNATLYLNTGVTNVQSKSGSGGYFYDKTDGCLRWVVDFKLATYSSPVWLEGAPYDLPSSSALGGTVPTTAEDCARFVQSVAFYKRPNGAPSFTSLGGNTTKGSWYGGSCHLYVSAGTITEVLANPSSSGWDTYRVSVAVRLRSTYQEVRAYSHAYIPPPK